MMNRVKPGAPQPSVPSEKEPGGAIRFMKWFVLIALLVLVLLALFLPDRGLAAGDTRQLAGRSCDKVDSAEQASKLGLPA